MKSVAFIVGFSIVLLFLAVFWYVILSVYYRYGFGAAFFCATITLLASKIISVLKEIRHSIQIRKRR